MESIELDMDDIFDQEGGDDGGNLPSTLPDLPQELEPLEAGDDNMPSTQDAENAEVLAKLKGMKGAGKKIVRRPQPKLDGPRLTGERGIATLPRVFKDVKFKGRGHEAEDLRVIMKRLEHWGHRLFPMMPFDDVIERIEKLGSKNDVKTCIKKMRLDIPVLSEDFVEEEKLDEPPSPRRGSDDFDAEDAFDEMMREEQENRQAQQAPPTPDAATPTSLPTHASEATPTSVAMPAAVPNGLTPDQREKMERNKRLAMEKRAARLAAQQAQGTAIPAVGSVESGNQPPEGGDKNTSDDSKTSDNSGITVEKTNTGNQPPGGSDKNNTSDNSKTSDSSGNMVEKTNTGNQPPGGSDKNNTSDDSKTSDSLGNMVEKTNTGYQPTGGSDKNNTSDDSKTSDSSGNMVEKTNTDDTIQEKSKQAVEKMDTDEDGTACEQNKETSKNQAEEIETNESSGPSEPDGNKSEEDASSKSSSANVPDVSESSEARKESSEDGQENSETVEQEETRDVSSNKNSSETVSTFTLKSSSDLPPAPADSESSLDKECDVDNCEADTQTDAPEGVGTESFPVNRHTDMDTNEGLSFETEESNSLKSSSAASIESEGFSVKGGLTVESSLDG